VDAPLDPERNVDLGGETLETLSTPYKHAKQIFSRPFDALNVNSYTEPCLLLDELRLGLSVVICYLGRRWVASLGCLSGLRPEVAELVLANGLAPGTLLPQDLRSDLQVRAGK